MQFHQVKRVARPVSENSNEGNLSSAIAIPKYVDGIEFRQEVCGLTRKIFLTKGTEKSLLLESSKEPAKLFGDVLGIAKGTPASRNANRSELSRPLIDILEQMMVDRTIVPYAESSRGQRLIEPL